MRSWLVDLALGAVLWSTMAWSHSWYPKRCCQRARGRIAFLRLSTPALAVLLATVPAKAVDLDELTVVTLAGDGSWGVATAGSQGPAIAAAIRSCQTMAARQAIAALNSRQRAAVGLLRSFVAVTGSSWLLKRQKLRNGKHWFGKWLLSASMRAHGS